MNSTARSTRRGRPPVRGRLRRAVASIVTASLAAATLVAVNLASPLPASAAAGDPFDPSEPVVFIAQKVPTQLQRAQTTGGQGQFSFQNEGGPAPLNYNAIGFNPADNYIYGMVDIGNASIPTGSLVRIGQGGTVTRVGTTVYTHTGNTNTRWFSGAFNPADGLYYISDSSPQTSMLGINVTTGAIARRVALDSAPQVQDFAFKDGYAWGVSTTGQIRRLNVNTGATVTYNAVFPATPGGYGAAWNFGNGNLGFSANDSGTVYQLEITNGASAQPTFRLVSEIEGPSSSRNDGTSIPGLPADLSIDKTGPATFTSGERISYQFTVVNNGQGVSSGWTVTDVLPTGLSNPQVTGDVRWTTTGSTVTVTGGRLGVGESKTFTITADTDVSPPACITNTATVAGNEQDPNSANNQDSVQSCALALAVTKTSDATADSRPGDVITYTVRATNTGAGDYTTANPAVVFDDLSGVLDDARYNDDATDGATVSGSTLTWSGPLAVGESIEVTYSVTVDDPVTGDFDLRNAVTPSGPGGSCEGVCETTTPVGAYRAVKSTETTEVVAGDTVEYSIQVTNTGQVAYTADDPASFTDDLSSVLDDATYNGDATSTSGAGVSYTAPELSWSGALGVGETVTITYSVTVNDPATGDRRLDNTVVTPPGSGGNCVEGSTDPACVANVPASSYAIAKSVSPGTALPGDTVTYTVTVTNTGALPYTDENPASFTDDLSRVLDDASYNGDVSLGGQVTGDTLTWAGPLAVGESIQVTYSVTVDDPVSGDFEMRNVVAPSSPGGECLDGQCTTETPVATYGVTKTANVQDVTLGGTVTYTVVVENLGQVAYTDESPASVRDDLSGVLDDATYNDDATSGAEVDGTTLAWSGPLEIGESVTITYSVTVNQPSTGDGRLRNTVVGDAPGSRCEGACETDTPIASYRVTKDVSSERATVGDRVTFSITVTNTGQVAYTDERPASFTDDLTSALRVASYNGDATNGAVYQSPVLSWSGAVGVGESITVTYSVTLRSVGEIRNVVVTPDGSGSNCVANSTDGDCSTRTVVVPPGLAVTGGALWIGGGIAGLALVLLGVWLIARRRQEAASA